MGQIAHGAYEPSNFGCVSIFHVRPCVRSVGKCWPKGTSCSLLHGFSHHLSASAPLCAGGWFLEFVWSSSESVSFLSRPLRRPGLSSFWSESSKSGSEGEPTPREGERLFLLDCQFFCRRPLRCGYGEFSSSVESSLPWDLPIGLSVTLPKNFEDLFII